MLYPSVSIDPQTANNSAILLPAGAIALIPIDLSRVRMTQITVLQLSLTEDFGMQAWLSEFPAGLSLIEPYPNVFPLVRDTPRPLFVHLLGELPPADGIIAKVSAGQYYLNVLNLTNSPAMFGFSQIDLS